MSAVSVGNLSSVVPNFVIIFEFTLVKGLMNAMNVENCLGIVPNSVNTGEATLEKSLTHAMNVGNFLYENLHSRNIREFT